MDTVKDDESTKEDAEEGGSSQPPQREVSPFPFPSPVETPSARTTSLRGRKLLFPSPPVAYKVKARRPFTRSSAK